MTSLRARLATGLVLSIVAMIGLLWLVTHVSVRKLLEEQFESRLVHDGEALLGGLHFDAAGNPVLDPQRIQGIYRQPFSGHYFVIQAGDRTIRSRSLWDRSLDVPPVEAGETRVLHVTGPEQQPLLQWTRGYRKDDRLVRLSVAEDLLGMQQGMRNFQLQLMAWSLAVIVVLLLIQQYIVARSLRPVAEAAREVDRLEHGELDSLRDNVPDEVRPLVQSINQLLQRQQQRLLRSREAIGNLAHEIKTPLTLLQQLVHEKVRDTQTAERLDAYSRRISGLVDRSLHRARLAGDSLGTSRFDLQRDLDGLIDALRRLHRDRPIQYEQRLDSVRRLPLEQQDGMELLGNLLDNAWKFARQRVSLSIRCSGDLEIEVEDDGPGIDAASLQSLTGRGARNDEETPGHGIGLSIVRTMVQELGGELRFSSSGRLGGLKVGIRIPGPCSTGKDSVTI